MNHESASRPIEPPTSPTGSLTQIRIPESLALRITEVSLSINAAWKRKYYLKILQVPKGKSKQPFLHKSSLLRAENTPMVVWTIDHNLLIEGPASTIVVQVLVSRPLKLDLVDAECNLSIDAIFGSFLLSPNDQTIKLDPSPRMTITLQRDSLSERLSAFVLSQSVIQEMETAQSGVNFISELPGHVEKLQGQANSLRGQFGKIIQELQKRQFCHRRLPEVSKKMKESEQLFQRVQGLVAFEQIKRPIKDVFECMESILETMEPLIKMDVLGQIAGFNKEKNLFELSINLKIFQEELGIVIRSLTQRKEKMIADMFKFSEEISPTSHE